MVVLHEHTDILHMQPWKLHYTILFAGKLFLHGIDDGYNASEEYG